MDLKLGHYSKDGIEVVDVGGEIDIYTAPRLRELLIDLAGKNSYQLIVNLDKVEFLDSTGLGVLVGGLKRVRAHDGSLDLVCTQERILKIFRITGLTKVFGIHETVDQAIAAKKGAPVRNMSPEAKQPGLRGVLSDRKDQAMAQTLPIPAGQPLEVTRKAAGQVVALAGAEAVAVQAAASITLAALLWPLIPAARAVAGLASALGQRLPLRPLPEQQVAW